MSSTTLPVGLSSRIRQRRRAPLGEDSPLFKGMRPVLPVLLLPLVSRGAFAQSVGGHAEISIITNDHAEKNSAPSCSVERLLPPLDEDLTDRWATSEMVKNAPYRCTCPMLKASYFCPHLGDDGYPMWEPAAVADGTCEPVGRDALAKEPLPPNSTILFYGNSHMRQMIEGVMCMFKTAIDTRTVTLTRTSSGEKADFRVGVDFQCRSCYGSKSMRSIMAEYGCTEDIDIKHACSCDDNIGVFEMANGAVLHYFFAHTDEDKHIEDALEAHGTDYDSYDAVFANSGNEPRLPTSHMLLTASEFAKNDIPFFWQSTYDGTGDIRDFEQSDRDLFEESGAYFVPISEMVKDLTGYTKGFVEHAYNPHFCMPGPPDEIGILFLRLIWAYWKEKRP